MCPCFSCVLHPNLTVQLNQAKEVMVPNQFYLEPQSLLLAILLGECRTLWDEREQVMQRTPALTCCEAVRLTSETSDRMRGI